MIRLTIDTKNATAQLVQLELTATGAGAEVMDFEMPRWRPGRYQLQHFAKNVQQVKAFSEKGDVLKVNKKTTHCWSVSAKKCKSITLRYSIYANQLDAGGIFVDAHQTYLNFVMCALVPKGLENAPWQVELKERPGMETASSLKEGKNNTWLCSSYDELLDSWIVQHDELHSINFMVEKIPTRILLAGAYRPLEVTLIRDFTLFMREILGLFDVYPHDQYTYLIHTLNYPHYHGVEHANSTIITLGPASKMHVPESYENLLGISCHEFFHVWNAKIMRPTELIPYDYFQETYFNTGYLIEGLTTYYGDLMLVRSGALSVDWYLKELSKSITRHANNPARFTKSMLDSSIDLWVDGYQRKVPRHSTSIYVLGSLLALLLDLKIREKTDQASSLDTLVKELFSRSKDTGYTHEMYKELINKFLGEDSAEYIQLIEKPGDIMPDLIKSFEKAGLTIEEKKTDNRYSSYGLRLEDNKIAEIDYDSEAYSKISIGDQITHINNQPFAESTGTLVGPISVKLIRKELEQEVMLHSNPDKNSFAYYEVSSEQIDLSYARSWLKLDGIN